MGLENQLILFLLVLAIIPSILFFVRRKEIPTKAKEEEVYSKEFWMFIFGTLVLLFSAVLITFTTSIPVFNKLAVKEPLYTIFSSFADWTASNESMHNFFTQLSAVKVGYCLKMLSVITIVFSFGLVCW